ncbi:MAG: A/G-specific adenine glycosylase [Acidothermaceae bacterium]
MNRAPVDPLVEAVTSWYGRAARDLPWRRPSAGPWAVLVSEIMLQQTPVARVLPAYERWLAKWPTASDLARDSPGEAVRAWDRLGYPRRALRLHAAAVAIVDRHGGRVPSSFLELRALPGIGDYTAAAVATFAFGQRHAVLDTNVRRVLARVVGGFALPASASVTVAERARAVSLLPDDEKLAARFSVALMELGALVCRAQAPQCAECPIVSMCAWHSAGAPSNVVAGRSQGYEGTDRQVRGRLLAVLRSARGPVPGARLDSVWPDADQRSRALDALVTDGLVQRVGSSEYCLPV